MSGFIDIINNGTCYINNKLNDKLINITSDNNNDNNEVSMDEKINCIKDETMKYNELYNNFLSLIEINEPNYTIINKNVYNDLEFFYDSYMNSSNSIFNKIDLTETIFGSIVLKDILNNPIDNISILNKRQTIIEEIVTDQSCYKNIQDSLKDIGGNENKIYWFWKNDNNEDDYHTKIHNMIFFNTPVLNFLNKNSLILQLTNYYKILVNPCIAACSPIIYIILPIICCKLSKVPVNFGIIYQVLKSMFTFKFSGRSTYYVFFSICVWIFLYLQGVYNAYITAKHTHDIINIIHEKMNTISNITKKINNLHINIKDKFKHIIDEKTYKQINESITYYNKLFDNKVFDKEPHLLSNRGDILSIYYTFIENKNNYLILLKYIGIIDSFYSVTSLYLNNHETNNTYSFVEYNIKSTKPLVNVNNIWHPYINDCVSNDININNNIIITGPNAAGKSTFIKGVALNIIFAQTLGIASCKSMELTPFSYINTYLQIPDCKGKESLFEAEMNRCKEYIDIVSNFTKGFTFIIMDELFSSTNYNEGFSAAYSICKYMTKFSKNLSIITTHYSKLSILEKKTNKLFKNYKFTINYDSDNNIIYEYKIKPGISNQYIALQLLKNNGFNSEIINDAIQICDNLVRKKTISKSKKNVKDVKEENNKLIMSDNIIKEDNTTVEDDNNKN